MPRFQQSAVLCLAVVASVALCDKTAKLSAPRRMLAATNVGSYSLFAGGFNGKAESDAVDIFDEKGALIRTDHLSQARALIAATSWGDMAFFAGGQDHYGNKSDVIDIYNSTSGKWKTAKLSIGRSMLTAISVGDLVMFAGGEVREHEGNTSKSDDVSRIDILDMNTGRWFTSELCIARKKLTSTTVGGKAIIAGGYLSGGGGSRAEWDMYDSITGKWSSGNLSSSRMRMQSASAGNVAFFISGMGDVCGSHCPVVDYYNASSDKWGTTALSHARYEFAAVSLGTKLLVTGGKQDNTNGTGGAWDLVETFDTSTGKWATRESPILEARSYLAGARLGGHNQATSTDTALIAGGDFQNGTTTDLVHFLTAN